MRGDTYTSTTKLVEESCCNCGVRFAMEKAFRDECLHEKAGKVFYCPAGHRQWYVGETDAQRAEKYRLRMLAERDQREATERQLVATRGVVTRQKKQLGRVRNGTCAFCNRHFKDLERHMKSKHTHEHV